MYSLEKGEMTTYFLVKGSQSNSEPDNSSMDGGDSDLDDDNFQSWESEERWIEWNVDIFKNLLKQIIASRVKGSQMPRNSQRDGRIMPLVDGNNKMPLEEVQEIIQLPAFDKRAAKRQHDNQGVEVPDFVLDELKEYVSGIGT